MQKGNDEWNKKIVIWYKLLSFWMYCNLIACFIFLQVSVNLLQYKSKKKYKPLKINLNF